jgi:hypothetical protein
LAAGLDELTPCWWTLARNSKAQQRRREVLRARTRLNSALWRWHAGVLRPNVRAKLPA